MTRTLTPVASATRYVAHFATSGKVDVVDNWLNQNAKAEWTLRTEGISDDLSTKKYLISFSDKQDYDRFRSRFAPNAATKRKV